MATTKKKPSGIVWRQAQPNPQWPDEIRLLIRFARLKEKAACACCHKQRRKMWTMLCPFVPHAFTQFSIIPCEALPPLALVCDDHPIWPTPEIADVIERAGCYGAAEPAKEQPPCPPATTSATPRVEPTK